MEFSEIKGLSQEDAAEWNLWRSGSLSHLPYRVLADYIRERVDAADAELIQTHLDECPLCADEFADLKAFARDFAADESEAVHPTPVPSQPSPAVQGTTESKESFGFLESVRRLLLPSPARPAWTVAAASFGFVLGGGLFWALAVSPLQRSVTQLQTELASVKAAVRRESEVPGARPAPDLAELKKALAESSLAMAEANRNYDRLMARMEAQTGQLNRMSQAYESLKTQGAVASRLSPGSDSPGTRRANLPATLRLPDLTTLALAVNTAARGAEGANPEIRSFALLSPMGTRTRAAAPTLRWQPLAGAASYRVTIRSVDGAITRQSTIPLKQSYWTAPELARGRVFEWQVVARDDSGAKVGETPIARFAILSPAEEKAYRAGLERYGNAALGSAAAAAEAGLWERAVVELDSLLLTERDAEARRRAEAWREQISAKRSRLIAVDTQTRAD